MKFGELILDSLKSISEQKRCRKQNNQGQIAIPMRINGAWYNNLLGALKSIKMTLLISLLVFNWTFNLPWRFDLLVIDEVRVLVVAGVVGYGRRVEENVTIVFCFELKIN
jgi:hypothetical protein